MTKENKNKVNAIVEKEWENAYAEYKRVRPFTRI